MLYAQEVWLNATEGFGCGETDVYETFTDNVGELYRAMQSEYGRCVSRVYVDRADGTPRPIGWVFQRRRRYTDTGETYLAETWVTVHEGPPTKTTKYHYA